MKSLALLLLTGLLLSQAQGQGLLSIGQNVDYTENVPLTYSLRLSGGYDRINYPHSTSDQDNVNSSFMQGGVGLTYADVSKVTPWNIGADFGVLKYLDNSHGDDLYYNSRIALNFAHSFTPRLKVSNNFYIAYEIEPDYGIGISTGRRAGQYLYGYNNLAIAYAWTERLSTTTSYTIQGIRYDKQDGVISSEDRLTHTFSQQVSYRLNPRTSVNAEYRYAATNYLNGSADGLTNPDYHSHFLLVGVDQAWSERTSASVRVGAEFYESERTSKTAPYMEASLNYKLSKRTNLRWYHNLGFDGSELGEYDARYSYRTGLVANYQWDERISTNAGVHYVHSSFEGNDRIASAGENEFDVSLGVSFGLWKNVSLDANYSFTTIASDVDFRDYNRHHVNVGLNASF